MYKKPSKTASLKRLLNEKVNILFGNSGKVLTGRLNLGNIENSKKNISLGGKGWYIVIDGDPRKIQIPLYTIEERGININNKTIEICQDYTK